MSAPLSSILAPIHFPALFDLFCHSSQRSHTNGTKNVATSNAPMIILTAISAKPLSASISLSLQGIRIFKKNLRHITLPPFFEQPLLRGFTLSLLFRCSLPLCDQFITEIHSCNKMTVMIWSPFPKHTIARCDTHFIL